MMGTRAQKLVAIQKDQMVHQKKITRQCTGLVRAKFHPVCVQLFLQGCLDKLQIACINSPACSPEHEREVQEHC